MKNILKFLTDFTKIFISGFITMLGAFLLSIFLRNQISFVGLVLGVIGILLLFPNLKYWENVVGNLFKSKKKI